jgi:hypothetical protein
VRMFFATIFSDMIELIILQNKEDRPDLGEWREGGNRTARWTLRILSS